MKIIVDFDNAFNVKNRDVDDFIALLYLIRKNADIGLVTTTYGNASIEEVNRASKKVFEDLKLTFPLALGSEDAGEKMAQTVNDNEGEVTILTLGSTTNIARALDIDPNLGKKARLVSMGTITEPLYIDGIKMNELNYSVNHEASRKVLDKFEDISILTANNCLDGYLDLDEIEDIFSGEDYLMSEARDWFDFHSADYEINYIVIWDLLAATYVTNPELFEDKKRPMVFKDPEKGLLAEDVGGKIINMPEVKNRKALVQHYKKVFYNKKSL